MGGKSCVYGRLRALKIYFRAGGTRAVNGRIRGVPGGYRLARGNKVKYEPSKGVVRACVTAEYERGVTGSYVVT